MTGRILLAGACSALALAAAMPAAAQAQQTAQQATPQGGARSGVIEEVVVTARRVAETEQSTPVSMTALSAEMLKDLNIDQIKGIAEVSPNLMISDAPSNGTGTIVFIRGIGQISVSSYADPPIAIYVDGVIQPRPVGNAMDLPDINHIEFLRGPQGTLFGRNTTGGAIQIYTKKPSQDFGGSLELGYGRYNNVDTSLVLNTGELGTTGIRTKLAFQRNYSDGYVRTYGRDNSDWAGYRRSTNGSFSVAKDFSDRFSADNRFFIDQTGSKPAYQVVLATGNALAYSSQSEARGGPPFLMSPTPIDQIYLDPRRAYDPLATAFGNTLNLNYEVSDALNIKSITGYRHLNQKQSGQFGGSTVYGPVLNPQNPAVPIQPMNVVTPDDSVKQHQESQELQASGALGEFSYVAGLYYFHESIWESLHTIFPVISGPSTALLAENRNTYTIDSTSKAAYANLNWKPDALDKRLEIAGGIRFTKDTLEEHTQSVSGLTGPGAPFAAKASWTNFGWSGTVSYHFSDSIMSYARGSSGYRSGGFNPSRVGSPSFNPEKAKAVEVGIKSELFDRKLRLNAALFKTFYKDLQIGQYNLSQTSQAGQIVNAGKATYEGFEFEGKAILGGGFALNGTVGFVQPLYQEYLGVNSAGQTINLAQAARFVFVSKWTYNIGGSWVSPQTGLGVLTAVANYAFQSNHYFNSLDANSINNSTNPSGELKSLNASLTLSDLPIETGGLRNFKIQIHGQNLLNHRYRVSFIDLGAYATASYNKPRTYGVRVTADF